MDKIGETLRKTFVSLVGNKTKKQKFNEIELKNMKRTTIRKKNTPRNATIRTTIRGKSTPKPTHAELVTAKLTEMGFIYGGITKREKRRKNKKTKKRR